jgi:hypothetical protein
MQLHGHFGSQAPGGDRMLRAFTTSCRYALAFREMAGRGELRPG